MKLRAFAIALIVGVAATGAVAEQVCVEEAAGVCLKYKTVAPKKAAPAQPARPTEPAFAKTPEAEVEKGLNLNRNEYRFVQSGLQKAGYYQGGIDGVMGGGSRKALAAWQAANGVPATGYLTFEQAIALQEGRSLTPAPTPTPEPVVAAPKNSAPTGETAPGHPLPERTYEVRRTVYVSNSVTGDVYLRLRRTSEAAASLNVQLVGLGWSGWDFEKECAIRLDEPVNCQIRNRIGGWQVNGDLPVLNVSGRTFSVSVEMW